MFCGGRAPRSWSIAPSTSLEIDMFTIEQLIERVRIHDRQRINKYFLVFFVRKTNKQLVVMFVVKIRNFIESMITVKEEAKLCLLLCCRRWIISILYNRMNDLYFRKTPIKIVKLYMGFVLFSAFGSRTRGDLVMLTQYFRLLWKNLKNSRKNSNRNAETSKSA